MKKRPAWYLHGVLLCLMALAHPAWSATYPCQTSEPLPAPNEPPIAIRDPVLLFENFGSPATDPVTTAQACVVVGPAPSSMKAVIGRAAAGQSPPGLWLNWNLALLGSDLALVDTFGTLASLAALPAPGQPPAGISLLARWRLGVSVNRPRPTDNMLLAQVEYEVCADPLANCAKSAANASYATVLMSPSGVPFADPKRSDRPVRHCLEPVDAAADPELRDLTVIEQDGLYRVFGCLASRKFLAFNTASFNVNLLAGDGSNAGAGTDGNTRTRIGPLFSGTPHMSGVVALLAVDIAPAGGNLQPVKWAATKLYYQGCSDPGFAYCQPQTTEVDLGRVLVHFEVAPP